MPVDFGSDELAIWKNSPITKAIWTEYQNRLDGLKELRNHLDEIEDATLEKVATEYLVYTARIKMLEDFLDIELIDLEPVEEDNED